MVIFDGMRFVNLGRCAYWEPLFKNGGFHIVFYVDGTDRKTFALSFGSSEEVKRVMELIKIGLRDGHKLLDLTDM